MSETQEELMKAEARIEYIKLLLKYTYLLVKEVTGVNKYHVNSHIPALYCHDLSYNDQNASNDMCALFTAIVDGKSFFYSTEPYVNYNPWSCARPPVPITKEVMTDTGDKLIEILEEAYSQVCGNGRLAKVDW